MALEIFQSAPQSNQRGIETKEEELVQLPVELASIEPAWD
jgi:hypothetical protein